MTQILYRVLSFDGGGIRGFYQAKLLEHLKARGLDVAERADILAGTSTGAIIAAALAIGKEPKKITDLYIESGMKIFPPSERPRGRIRRVVKAARSAVSRSPSYSSAVLKCALESEFGVKTELGACPKRLIVPAISLNQYKLKVFDSKNEADKKKLLVDVVLASAAAPTYFLPAQVGDTQYVDGGLCCNNPAFRVVAQLSREGVELTRIYVLSISTGAVPITKDGNEFLNLHNFRWARPVIDIAMSGSSDLAAQDGALVGYHHRITEGFESKIDLDDYEEAVAHLPSLAENKANEDQIGVRRWLDGPQATGLDFAGTWETKFTWGEPGQSDSTDKLRVYQCGDYVRGETVPGCLWQYTLSGMVQGEVLIGAWKGRKLQGNFLLIMSKENGTVSGHWVGTGDANPYFGRWVWKRENE